MEPDRGKGNLIEPDGEFSIRNAFDREFSIRLDQNAFLIESDCGKNILIEPDREFSIRNGFDRESSIRLDQNVSSDRV